MAKERNDLHLTGRSIRLPQDKTRTFPIGEPSVGTMVFISDRHVRTGVQNDPWNCPIANAACDTMGAVAAMVGATIAYLVVRVDGETVALRYGIPPKTRRMIRLYDATGEMPAEGFRLLPVRPSDRSDSKRARQKRTRKRWDQYNADGVHKRTMKPRDVRSASHDVVTIATPQKENT